MREGTPAARRAGGMTRAGAACVLALLLTAGGRQAQAQEDQVCGGGEDCGKDKLGETNCACTRTCAITKNCCAAPHEIDKVCADGPNKPFVIKSVLDEPEVFHLVKDILREKRGVHVNDTDEAKRALATAALDTLGGFTAPVCKNVCTQLLLLKKKVAIVSRIQQAYLLESFFLWRTKWKALQTARGGLAAHRLLVMPVLDTPLARRIARGTTEAAIEAALEGPPAPPPVLFDKAAASESPPPPPPSAPAPFRNLTANILARNLASLVQRGADTQAVVSLPWAFETLRKAVRAATGFGDEADDEALAAEDLERYEDVTVRFHNHTLAMFDTIVDEQARLATALAAAEADVRAAEEAVASQERVVSDMAARAGRLEARVAEAIAQARRLVAHAAAAEAPPEG